MHLEYNTPMEQTIGQKLKEVRESRGITLEEIADRTRIHLTYLRALEANDLEDLPSPMQVRGFLRLYASELDVEIESLNVEGYHLFNRPVDEEPTSDSESSVQDEEIEPASQEDEAETLPEPLPAQDAFPAASGQPSTHTEEDLPSSNTFLQIGQKLYERRNLLSLSLEDIKSNLHIRKHYIESIEEGHFENLPSPVQAKGMLANYAEFLNLDADPLLLAYADGLQQKRLEKTQETKKKRSAKEISPTSLKLRNFFSLDLLVIAIIFIGFAAFVIWGVNRITSADSPEIAATSLPEVADVLLATSSPISQPTPSLEVTTPLGDAEGITNNEETPLFTSVSSTNVINVVIVPLQRVWVQVTTDSELVFEGRLVPGNAYDYSGAEKVEILTGNAGAIQIYFNDQDLGSMGLIGQVSDMVFTTNGLIIPTATITPTPTNTPLTSPTPSPTPTLSLTSTETND